VLLQHAAPVVKYQQIDNITALFYVVNVSNLLLLAFDEVTHKVTQFISNVCLCYSNLSLLCQFHSNNPNGCQDITDLLLGYLN